MHRSASTSRASDEFMINLSPATKGSPGMKSSDIDKIPMYNHPISDVTKKEKEMSSSSHFKSSSGENAVHLIPIVLILCVFILWVFSHPVADITNKDGSIVQIEGMNIHGHGNQSHLPSIAKPKDLLDQQLRRSGNRIAERFLVNDKSG